MSPIQHEGSAFEGLSVESDDLVTLHCEVCNRSEVLTLREEARICGPFFCSDRCEDFHDNMTTCEDWS